MPYVWEDNQIWFSHMGRSIHFIHKHDDASQPTRECWYGTTPYSSDEGGCETTFDIRDVNGLAPEAPILEQSVQWGSRENASCDYERYKLVVALTNGELEQYMGEGELDPHVGWVRAQVPRSAVLLTGWSIWNWPRRK